MYKYLITLLLLCSNYGLLAQSAIDSTAHGNTYSVAVEPFYGLNYCFKTSLEIKPANSSLGFELTPEFYSGATVSTYTTSTVSSTTTDKISGFGLGLYVKKYLPGSTRHPAILNFGATYRKVNIDYTDKGFVPLQQNGLTYYRYQPFEDVLKARNLMVNATISIKAINSFVLLEPYMGMGYKFGSTSATYPGYRTENAKMYDYGYRGFTWLIGLKFGFNYRPGR